MLVVLECALRGMGRLNAAEMLDRAAAFIRDGRFELLEIRSVAKSLLGRHCGAGGARFRSAGHGGMGDIASGVGR